MGDDDMRVYVASSWRNAYQPTVVEALTQAGHDVYDFRNPTVGDHGFDWSQIDARWRDWSRDQYVQGLEHPASKRGFGMDMDALTCCDVCVLVLPCGRSSHLEAGWAVGAGKRVILYMPEPQEPELMYKMTAAITITVAEILEAVSHAS
jgi:hypothetical protein